MDGLSQAVQLSESLELEKTEEVFAYGIWNPGFWNPEYSSRNPESQLRLEVLLTNSGIRYLQSGIHGLESRIQDCPGFPYMGRATDEIVVVSDKKGPVRGCLHGGLKILTPGRS